MHPLARTREHFTKSFSRFPEWRLCDWQPETPGKRGHKM